MVADGNLPPVEKDYGSPRTNTSTRPEPGFAEAAQNIGAAWAAAQRYLTAQAARLKVAIRNIAILFTIGVIGIIFVISIFVSAAVLIMAGTADGLSELLGGRQWAGDLITGSVVTFATALAGYLAYSSISKAARLRTVSSYSSAKNKN
jgi:hypothetical protein